MANKKENPGIVIIPTVYVDIEKEQLVNVPPKNMEEQDMTITICLPGVMEQLVEIGGVIPVAKSVENTPAEERKIAAARKSGTTEIVIGRQRKDDDMEH